MVADDRKKPQELSSSGSYTGDSSINRAIPHGLGVTPKRLRMPQEDEMNRSSEVTLFKEFSCACGCRSFTLVRRTYAAVDFSREGAIEGHPFVRNAGEQFDCLLCSDCGAEVPDEQAQEMLKEIM